MPRLKTIDIESAVKQILDEYKLECTEDMKEAVKEAAKVGVKKVKENSRNSFNGKNYYRGWTSTLEEGRLSAQGIIYNSKLPGLPHLLEKGHAKRGGGRVNGRLHIEPVQDELVKIFEEELEKRI